MRFPIFPNLELPRVFHARVTALNVNGKKLRVDADSETSLLSVLRND